MSSPLLRARNISASGQPGGVDIDIARGEIVAITGPSSALSFRTLRALAGVDADFSGDLEINGIDLHLLDETRWLQLRRETGLVSARVPLLSTMSAILNVMLPLNYHHPEAAAFARDRSEALLEELGFDGNADALPSELDGTQRFTLQLARELILDPLLLFIEEPFSMHAVADWAALAQRLVALAQDRNMALVIATANLSFVQQHAARCLFVNEDIMELLATDDMLAGFGSPESRQFLATVTTWPREPAQ